MIPTPAAEPASVATALQQLKERTAGTHVRVENRLALLDPDLSTRRLAEVVGQLSGFWAVNEPAVDEWFATHSASAAAMDWPRRRRRELFAHDLSTLEALQPARGIAPRAPQVFAVVGLPEVFGWLYVAEGSTLGGSIINRHLRGLPHLGVSGLRCLAPYAEGPGPMWRSFRYELHRWAAGGPERSRAVVAAAVATFDALDGWVADARRLERAVRRPEICHRVRRAPIVPREVE
jgi:heme oxygenase